MNRFSIYHAFCKVIKEHDFVIGTSLLTMEDKVTGTEYWIWGPLTFGTWSENVIKRHEFYSFPFPVNIMCWWKARPLIKKLKYDHKYGRLVKDCKTILEGKNNAKSA